MIGGWRPWERLKVARRLARHARHEGGQPPPELLRRLRDDVPDRPVMAHVPAAGGGERRGVSRRWVMAASLAVALAAGVIGPRVWERQLRLAGEPATPALARARPAGQAGSRRPAPPPRDAMAEPSSRLESEAAPDAAAPPRNQPAPSVPPRPDEAPPASAAPPPRSVSAERSAAAAGRSAPPAGPSPAEGGAAGAAASSAARPETETHAEEPPSTTARKALDRIAAAAPAPPSPERQATGAAPPGDTPAAAPSVRSGSAAGSRRAAAASPVVASAEALPAPAPAPARPAPAPAPPAAPAAGGWLRSSFGADTGTSFYRRLRHDLMDEGRLPRAASVRAGELANAFDLAAPAPAAGRPELLAEGAPLPAAGDAYLLRFDARGLRPSSGLDTVEVEFDPAVVARFRRVGATARGGVAAALYEVELRQPAAMAPAGGGEDRIVAMLRAVSRERAAAPDRPAGSAGAPEQAFHEGDPRAAGAVVLAERVVRLSDLRPSWDAASPALRASALAVELARALAAREPAPRLQELRARAQALAAELPDDPKAAELLRLVRRAADLAAATGGARSGGAPPP